MRPKRPALPLVTVFGSGIIAMMLAVPATAGDMKNKSDARGAVDMKVEQTATGAADLTVDTVDFNELSPQVQAAVQRRMGPEQKLSELVETTILNRLAVLGDGYTLAETRPVGPDYVLLVNAPDGTQATWLYEVDVNALREVQM